MSFPTKDWWVKISNAISPKNLGGLALAVGIILIGSFAYMVLPSDYNVKLIFMCVLLCIVIFIVLAMCWQWWHSPDD